MKGKMKKSWLCLSLVLCMTVLLSVTAFAAGDKKLSEEEIASFKAGAAQLIEQIAGFTDEEIENYLEQDVDFVTASLTSWKNAKEELGAFVAVGEQTVEADGRDVIITSNVEYELKSATVELIADTKAGAYTNMAFNVNYTMGEKMQQAGLNTLMGLGIVFLMLFFLSFIIGMFKHIGKLEAKIAGKKETAAPAPVKEVPVAESEPEEELADDEELVAVIAAAIAAYEGTSTDGFVVRSIKKSNSRKWKRA